MNRKTKVPPCGKNPENCMGGHKIIVSQAEDLLEFLGEFEKSKSVESAHQSRVLTRKILAALKCCNFLYPPMLYKKTKEDFRKLRRAFGPTREFDVALEDLKTIFPEPSENEKDGIKFLSSEFKKAARKARRSITSEKINEFKKSVGRLIQGLEKYSPDLWECEFCTKVDSKVAKIESKVLEKLKRIRSVKEFDKVHDFRIAGKELKYAQEFLTTLEIPQNEKKITKSKKTHKTLGTFNDLLTMKIHIEKFILNSTLNGPQVKVDIIKSLKNLDRNLKKIIRANEQKVERLINSLKK